MSLDLSTLQKRYPHGSRWRNGCWPAPSIVTVVGWDPGDPSGDLVITTGIGGAAHARVEHTLVRIPDPPPCPITEPVTLRCSEVNPGHVCSAALGGRTITLHPPGALIDGKRYVVVHAQTDEGDRWVPADREFILGEWGMT